MAIIHSESEWVKNQSRIHEELSHRALTWITNMATGRGFRGDVEIPINKGYIADAAGQLSFQWRFYKRYGIAFGELLSCIFESKVSRPDFFRTFDGKSNRHSPIASLHWVVTPKELVSIEEVPDFWGLLEDSGNGLREIKKPIFQIASLAQHDALASAILWYGPRRRNRHHEIRICQHCCKDMSEAVHE